MQQHPAAHPDVGDSVAIATDCVSCGGVAAVLTDDDGEESSAGSVPAGHPHTHTHTESDWEGGEMEGH